MGRTFFKYTVSSVLAMWVFSFYSMADGFFVSIGVGPLALAGVNIVMPFINVLFGVSILCSTGSSMVISMSIGKGDMGRAKQVFMTNLVFLGGLSVAISALGLFFVDELVVFLGATPALFPYVKSYISITLLFVFFFITTYYLEVITRADGFPKLAAFAVVLAGVSNIVLDYFFVLVFRWGIAGAAWATGIAQVMSTLLLLGHFLGRRTNFGFCRFRFDPGAVFRSMRLGLGEAVTEFSLGAVIFMFNHRLLQITGEVGVISYTVMAYITTMVLVTMTGISQGVQPLLSYHHGKGDREACSYLLKVALKTAVVCSVVWFIIAEVFTGEFVSLFINPVNDGHIHDLTVDAFRIYAISYIFIGANVILSTFFSSVNRPLYGVAISVSRGLVLIALALIALPMAFGVMGIWISPIVSEAVCFFFAALLLRREYERSSESIAQPA